MNQLRSQAHRDISVNDWDNPEADAYEKHEQAAWGSLAR